MGMQKAEGRKQKWFAARAFVRLYFCILLLTSCATTKQSVNDFDLKIAHGRIIDGTGAPWFRADVGIRGDRIVAMGDLSQQTAVSTIDAQDHVVAPGFIDLLGQSQNS